MTSAVLARFALAASSRGPGPIGIRIKHRGGNCSPLPVILGLDPRISRHAKDVESRATCLQGPILGSSPRMTLRGRNRSPPPVILGLDPRVARHAKEVRRRTTRLGEPILGSSPRMTLRGRVLASSGLILTPMGQRPWQVRRACPAHSSAQGTSGWSPAPGSKIASAVGTSSRSAAWPTDSPRV